MQYVGILSADSALNRIQCAICGGSQCGHALNGIQSAICGGSQCRRALNRIQSAICVEFLVGHTLRV